VENTDRPFLESIAEPIAPVSVNQLHLEFHLSPLRHDLAQDPLEYYCRQRSTGDNREGHLPGPRVLAIGPKKKMPG
jgi:hypothetical protein